MPLFRSRSRSLKIERVALKHGDYAIQGHETEATIERKQMADLCGYIAAYDRDNPESATLRKLEALSHMQFAALIIEASPDDIMTPYQWGNITPEHIRGFLTSVRARYGVHVYISNKRRNLERFILDHLTKVYRILEGK